jgi:hypothetical protein
MDANGDKMRMSLSQSEWTRMAFSFCGSISYPVNNKREVRKTNLSFIIGIQIF